MVKEDPFEVEKRLEDQYQRWHDREVKKFEEAYLAGDMDAARRHNENAKRFNKMSRSGLDRMREEIKKDARRAGDNRGCWPLLTLISLSAYVVVRSAKRA